MSASDLVNLSGLMDHAKCFALVRQHRWPESVCCPGCNSSSVIRDGCDDTQPHRQRYRCKACASRFDDLTSPNNSSDRPKSAQATKHLGQRFHCKKLHQTAHSHSCERYQRLGFDRAFLVNNAG